MKMIPLFLAALLVTTTVSAQRKLSEAQKAEYEVYQQKLNLTADQSPKVRTIDSVFIKGVGQLKNSSDSKLSKFKKLKSLRSEKDKQMKAVLTKEQFKIYKEYQKEKKEEFKANRQNRIEP